MSTPLPNWTRQNSFQQNPHQRVVDRVNETSNLTSPDGGEVRRTPYGTGTSAPPRIEPIEVARFRVTTVASANSDTRVMLAQRYKADGSDVEGGDVQILSRQPHFVGQDVVAARLAGGVTDLTTPRDKSISSGGWITSTPPAWEELRTNLFCIVQLSIIFGSEGTTTTTRGGWYETSATIVYIPDMPIPGGGSVTDGRPVDVAIGGISCEVFNWNENGMGDVGSPGQHRGARPSYAAGFIVGYTSGGTPKPIVFAIGGMPAKESSGVGTAAAWARTSNDQGADLTVLVDVDFATSTKHFQSFNWDSYGKIYVKTAKT